MSLAARRIWPEDWGEEPAAAVREPGRLAEVIPLRPLTSAPIRHGIRGHHPDCPYPNRDVDYCHVCQGILKGGGC